MAEWIGVGTSRERDSFRAAREASLLAKAATKQQEIDLVIIFSSIYYNPENIVKGVKQIMPEAKIIGCSGSGVIMPRAVEEYGLAILAIKTNNIKFGLGYCSNINEKDARSSGQELARMSMSNFKTTSRDIFIMFADGLIRKSSDLILGVEDILGRSFPLIGAASSDDFKFTKTYQYFQNNIFSNAAVGILIGSSPGLGFGIKHGWKPIGKPRVVTDSEGNIIKKINDKPAIDMYKEYFEDEVDELKKEKLSRLTVLYPIGIDMPGENEFILRNILETTEEGFFICQGDVPVGSEISLMLGSKDFCIQAAKEAAEEAKKELKDKPASLIIIFDSAARKKLLGRLAYNEIDAVREVFGKTTPVFGFYSYGEIAPLKAMYSRGASHFHNETIAVLAIA
ncbi:MAG TPA: FIST N-terminal domain-containing protein [Candidatus Omnitrophota bacterium]|nr:FIST N-terminal domain-containing protein [Candidatus Omnitrophota bacterium]